jgi:cupin 2 domain-containing protein
MSIFDKLPPKDGEIFEILYKQKDIEITHILSSSNLDDHLYNQNKDEFVILLEGGALLEMDGKEVDLKKGEYIFIKAHTKHKILRCENGSHWLAIYIKNSDKSGI